MDALPTLITADEFVPLLLAGWIIDGRNGGLIVGRSHADGNIIMISHNESSGDYKLIGLVEGQEFILNRVATAEYFVRLTEINSDQSPCDFRIETTTESRLIHTTASPHDRFLLVDYRQQYIINANATRRHFAELERLNNLHHIHSGQILNDAVIAKLSEL